MSLDTISGKVDDYRQRKDLHDETEESVLLDHEKSDALLEESGGVDESIRSIFSEIEAELRAELSALESEAADLESEKQDLVGEITEEICTNDEVRARADALSDHRFTGRIDRVSQTAAEYIAELERMLNEMDAEYSGSSASGAADSDTGILGHSDIADLITDTARVKKIMDANVISILDGYKRIIGSHSIENDLQAVNPNFVDDIDSPWANNCQRCVTAYEARRRGYDVEALPLPSENDPLMIMNSPKGWPTVYQNGQLINCSAATGELAGANISRMVSAWGPGARAIVRVRWQGSGGHVFIAENDNGRVRFIDPQNNNPDASDYFLLAKGDNLYCMRIDNLPFSSRVQRCCKSR